MTVFVCPCPAAFSPGAELTLEQGASIIHSHKQKTSLWHLMDKGEEEAAAAREQERHTHSRKWLKPNSPRGVWRLGSWGWLETGERRYQLEFSGGQTALQRQSFQSHWLRCINIGLCCISPRHRPRDWEERSISAYWRGEATRGDSAWVRQFT